MVVRRQKTRNRTQLGKRTHGHGNTKNNRGAGNRGGRGRAGSQKHKFSKYWQTFGQKVRLKGQPKGKALNVGQVAAALPGWKEKGWVKEEEGMLIVDGRRVGISKLLGGGEIGIPIYVQHIRVSEKARTKIEGADGEIEEGFESGTGETKVADPVAGEGDSP
ncbi:MAG: uL15m family ribosomal protein [Candidatus Diapherotrites archaeon]|nr:uL15m family ribosomal protein [Candidatus Diapherotrites archaeon]MDZ4256019.1 uL15m family ribosomal protein [archaeon]